MLPTYISPIELSQLHYAYYLNFLRLQQLHYQQVMQGTQIKEEEVPSEQPIESKETIESVKVQTKENKKIKKTKRKSTRKTYNNGHWTEKEHRLYLQFIDSNKEIMMKSEMKKHEKIFKQMSLCIKTRSPSQCRSHHQKFNPF